MTQAFLYFFQCSMCKTTATSPVHGRFNCLGCARWMRTLYSTPAITDEQKALAARGLVYNPYALPPQPWTCDGCQVEFTIRPIQETTGRYCRECAVKVRSARFKAIQEETRRMKSASSGECDAENQ